MPELPEVEGFRLYIERTSLRQIIGRVEVRDPYILKGISPDELKKVLTGRRFECVRRHGKYLFLRMDNWRHVFLHFGMTGEPKYFKDMSLDPEFDRLLITFGNCHHLAYNDPRKLGSIGLTDDPDAFLREKRVGPDAICLDCEGFMKAIKSPSTSSGRVRRRGAIKTALMNQRVIAGIGNIYADEILFQARIHPLRHIAELSDEQRKRLFESMRKVLKKGIEHNVNGKPWPSSYLIPRRRKKGKCPCGGKMETLKIGERTAYFCPTCQAI